MGGLVGFLDDFGSVTKDKLQNWRNIGIMVLFFGCGFARIKGKNVLGVR